MSLVDNKDIKLDSSNILFYKLGFSKESYNKILKFISNEILTELVVSKLSNLSIDKAENTNDFNIYTKKDNKVLKLDNTEVTIDDEKNLNIIKTLNNDEKIMIINDNIYKLNDEFHITVLFTGGKKDDREKDLNEHLGKTFEISINKIGISNKYISLGVSFDSKLPYYGNEVKHITFGLNKFIKGVKVFPKDSYTALQEDKVITLDTPFVIESLFETHNK